MSKVAFIVFIFEQKNVITFNNKFRRNIEMYCSKNNYDFIFLNKLITPEANIPERKKFWQKMLIPSEYRDYDFVICMDENIYINSNAPPLPLNEIPKGKIAAVNERKYFGNYEWRERLQIKNGFERTGKDWHALSGEIKDYHDHINSGFIIFQPEYHADCFKELYEKNIDNYSKYHQNEQSIISTYVIDNNIIYWLDERFNRIWAFWRDLFYPNFNEITLQQKTIYIHNFINLNYFVNFTSGIEVELIDNIRDFTLCIPTMNRYDTFLKNNLSKYINYPLINEIIITDETGDDIDKIKRDFNSEKLVLIKNENRLGPFLNKIKACKLATNEWIALIDSDNFVDENFFTISNNYINKLIQNEKNIILSPSKAKPNFDFTHLSNFIFTKNNFQENLELEKTTINNYNYPAYALFNNGNYIINKYLMENLNLDEELENIKKTSACDVIYMNLLFMEQLDLNFHVVQNLEYEHVVHQGSIYLETYNNNIDFINSVKEKFYSMK
jgi:hypothetical protein